MKKLIYCFDLDNVLRKASSNDYKKSRSIKKNIQILDFLKNVFFKNDKWKKNEFISIIKRFKSCEVAYTISTLNN